MSNAITKSDSRLNSTLREAALHTEESITAAKEVMSNEKDMVGLLSMSGSCKLLINSGVYYQIDISIGRYSIMWN